MAVYLSVYYTAQEMPIVAFSIVAFPNGWVSGRMLFFWPSAIRDATWSDKIIVLKRHTTPINSTLNLHFICCASAFGWIHLACFTHGVAGGSMIYKCTWVDHDKNRTIPSSCARFGGTIRAFFQSSVVFECKINLHCQALLVFQSKNANNSNNRYGARTTILAKSEITRQLC